MSPELIEIYLNKALEIYQNKALEINFNPEKSDLFSLGPKIKCMDFYNMLLFC